MSQKELKRSHIIYTAVDGKITVGQASKALNLSTRRIKRLKASYKKMVIKPLFTVIKIKSAQKNH